MEKTLFLILLTIPLLNFYSYSPDNSIGFIFLKGRLSSLEETIHLPRNVKIEINSNIRKGYLFFPNCKYATNECWQNYAVINSKKYPIKIEDYVSVDYDGYCLKYYEIKDNKILILSESVPNGVWISKEELSSFNLEYIDYLSFFKLTDKIYFSTCILNLRTKPNKESQKILTISNHNFKIKLLGNFNNLWAEVEVMEVDDYMLDPLDQKILRKYHGWTKILDDKGFPNIWFSPKE
ncbi:MAG: hypothetical protein KAZ87_12320 [Spirochaetes bacterium]|nr:hypothetical protein [Spirochaetota bacterium]